MKTIRLFTIALLGITIASGCNPEKSASEAEGGTAVLQETEKAIPVRIMSLEKETISRTIDYTATLQAWEELYIAPASPGGMTWPHSGPFRVIMLKREPGFFAWMRHS